MERSPKKSCAVQFSGVLKAPRACAEASAAPQRRRWPIAVPGSAPLHGRLHDVTCLAKPLSGSGHFFRRQDRAGRLFFPRLSVEISPITAHCSSCCAHTRTHTYDTLLVTVTQIRDLVTHINPISILAVVVDYWAGRRQTLLRTRKKKRLSTATTTTQGGKQMSKT